MTKKETLRTSIILLTIMMMLSIVATASNIPFKDVPANAWYEQSITYCYENNLMNGTSNTTFEPELEMSRAMLVTVLYRIAGSPETDLDYPFTDIEAGSWYEPAVAWAYENMVVNGTSTTTFSPSDNISRESMVTIFYRYAKSKGYDVSSASLLEDFADRSKISAWAYAAMQWAVADGLINGKGNLGLVPQGDTTRAECATVICRFVQWTVSESNNAEAMVAYDSFIRNNQYEIDEYESAHRFAFVDINGDGVNELLSALRIAPYPNGLNTEGTQYGNAVVFAYVDGEVREIGRLLSLTMGMNVYPISYCENEHRITLVTDNGMPTTISAYWLTNNGTLGVDKCVSYFLMGAVYTLNDEQITATEHQQYEERWVTNAQPITFTEYVSE